MRVWTMTRATAVLLAVGCLSPSAGLASVGKIALVEQATRTPENGKSAPLEVGSEISLKDTLRVQKGSLKLALSDNSVIMLSQGSELVITEADFQGQERKGFSARLVIGNIWSHVTKMIAGGSAKFEVATERAVAGVRGTIFRVDAAKLISAATTRHRTVVSVLEGQVGVNAKIAKPVASAAKAPPAGGGKRVQVAGPAEISQKEWEDKFVALQANQQVTIDEDLWKEAAYSPPAQEDAFAKFIKANQ